MERGNKPIWFTTGNPFVDTGQEMMASLSGKMNLSDLTLEDVETLLPRIIDLYMKSGWNKDIHSIFPNSKLVNGSVKRPREEYLVLLQEWHRCLVNNETMNVPEGTVCAVSGGRAHTYLGRTYLPMSGKNEGNFHSFCQGGMPVSASVALAVQFLPFALKRIMQPKNGRMLFALPHFNNTGAQATWVDNRADEIDFADTVGAGGVGDVGTSRTVNAFFRLVERLVRDQRDFPKSGVTLYLFNNYNQVEHNFAINIHYMPAKVFAFIQAAMSPSVEKDWQRIVWRGYPKNHKIEDEDDALRRFSNSVYERLLDGRSISGFFMNRRERCPVVRGQSGWILFRHYLEEVRGLDRERIENLRELGDRIAPLVRGNMKRLYALERASRRGDLTSVLYRISKDALREGDTSPLITFEILVSDLFPHDVQYSDWKEVQYLLLFRIYEQLFNDLKKDPNYANTNTDESLDEGEDNE